MRIDRHVTGRSIRLYTQALMVCTLCFGQVAEAQERAGRPFTVDDLFRLEELGRFLTRPAVFSPDGEWLAYVRVRARSGAPAHNQPYMAGNDRADVWVAPTGGGEPINITRGAADRMGYWAPVWSPDGGHLAMYCTDGDRIFLCVWTRSERRARRLGDGGLDLLPDGPVWLSAREVVVPALAPDERPASLWILRRTPELATRGWERVRAGREVTASILDSGIEAGERMEPHGRLLRYDVETGREEVLFEGTVVDLTASPAGGVVAGLVRTGSVAFDPETPLTHQADFGVYEPRLFDRSGVRSHPELEAVGRVVRRALFWSPDGSRLAFFAGAPKGNDASSLRTLMLDVATGSVTAMRTSGLNPRGPIISYESPLLRWSAGGDLAIRARRASGMDGTASNGNRMDWWLLDENGEPRNLTAALESAPDRLRPEPGAPSWIAVADGDLWRITAAGREPRNLTREFEPRITGFAGPEDGGPDPFAGPLIVRASEEDDEHDALYRLDPASARLDPIASPVAGAELVAASAGDDRLAFDQSDRSGTILWLTGGEASSRRALFRTNTFLREVAEAEARPIEYRGLDGDTLVAWLLLPIGYEEGRRYPLVTRVYAGSVMSRDRPPSLSELNRPHPLNYQLLPAHGFATLVPSMPIEGQGTAIDPYMELMKGVLPAVDRAIELGIADPDRLAVLGQSYGGYSTYGLITQTDRFDAAIALAGVSDLVSLYGQFGARVRYEDDAHENLFSLSISETGQISMGGPPWENLQRYVRNSPLTYAHRVHTPLLIIQGDLDYVAIQQGEEFFTALRRQGKRARFVRYWGEGHVLSSPANIRHFWKQIYAWLDEFLATAPKPATAQDDGSSTDRPGRW